MEEDDNSLLASLETLALSYEQASSSSLLSLYDCLEKLIQTTRIPFNREALEKHSALERIVQLIPVFSIHCSALNLLSSLPRHRSTGVPVVSHASEDSPASTHVQPNWVTLRPLQLLLKILRNMCAGGSSLSKIAFRLCGGHDILAEMIERVISSAAEFSLPSSDSTSINRSEDFLDHDFELSEDLLNFLSTALQLLGNFCGEVEANQNAAWHRFFPRTFSELAQIRHRKIQEPLCMIIFTCLRCDLSKSENFSCTTDGVNILVLLLRAAFDLYADEDKVRSSDDGNCGGGEWLELLVQSLFVHKSFFNNTFDLLYQESLNCMRIDKTRTMNFLKIGEDQTNHILDRKESNMKGVYSAEQVVLLSMLHHILKSGLRPNSSSFPLIFNGGFDFSKEECKFEGASFLPGEVANLFDALLDVVRISANRIAENSSSPASSPLKSLPSKFSRLANLSPVKPSNAIMDSKESHTRALSDLGDRNYDSDALKLGLSLLSVLFALSNDPCIGVFTKESDASTNVADSNAELILHSQKRVVSLVCNLLKSLGPPEQMKRRESQNGSTSKVEREVMRLELNEETEEREEGNKEIMGEKDANQTHKSVRADRVGLDEECETELCERNNNFESLLLFPSFCPYIGYRSDIMSVIGNACFQNQIIQNLVREEDALILILQQCMVDEKNPYLREWSLWCISNLIRDNKVNQDLVRELEMMEAVQDDKLLSMGFKIDIDEKTKKPKLVNIGASEKSRGQSFS